MGLKERVVKLEEKTKNKDSPPGCAIRTKDGRFVFGHEIYETQQAFHAAVKTAFAGRPETSRSRVIVIHVYRALSDLPLRDPAKFARTP